MHHLAFASRSNSELMLLTEQLTPPESFSHQARSLQKPSSNTVIRATSRLRCAFLREAGFVFVGRSDFVTSRLLGVHIQQQARWQTMLD
ncbi:hypothetical protein DOTSEDRAFT_83351, partial [Dothistroma septosporum NZE10]